MRAETLARADRLGDLSLTLHREPELAFAEHRAAALLTAEPAAAGFAVEHGSAGLPTAFLARAGTGGGPQVALLLEYDALPDLGHACGHDLIARLAREADQPTAPCDRNPLVRTHPLT
jgi:metal-dependent amidase/aminoacylase/carboxypeptidase family protein